MQIQFLIVAFAMAFAACASASESIVELQNMKIEYLSKTRFKASIRGSNDKHERFSIDCLDGRGQANTLLFVDSSAFRYGHQVFEGVGDFYCQGIINVLINGVNVDDDQPVADPLKVGDLVKIQLPVTYLAEIRSGKKYEKASIKNVLILIQQKRARILMSNPGTQGQFTSLEPASN